MILWLHQNSPQRRELKRGMFLHASKLYAMIDLRYFVLQILYLLKSLRQKQAFQSNCRPILQYEPHSSNPTDLENRIANKTYYPFRLHGQRRVLIIHLYDVSPTMPC